MNPRTRIQWTLAGFTLLGLSGCTNVPKDAGFSDVRQTVAERTGQFVQWRGQTAADAAVDAAVHAALQRELTAEDAVRVALLNNLNLQATYQDLGVAQADLVQAGLLKNPVLSFERRFSGQATELDIVGDFLDLFFIPLRRRIAGAAFEAAKLRTADAVLAIAVQTRQAFYTLQAAEQMAEMRRGIVAATAASADAAGRMRDAGNLTLLALRSEQKLAAQAKLELAAAEAQIVQDRERLNVLMGVWGLDTQWRIASRLPELPADEPPARGLESLALSRRLDLAAARQEIEVAAQSLGLTSATRLVPNVSLGAHFEREVDGARSIGPSIELPIPLFDQGQARLARGKALLRQAQLRYAALAIDIRSQVRADYSRLVAARDRTAYYQRDMLPLSQQIVEQTQLQYNAMQVGVLTLLQAKQAQIDAGREYIQSLRDYWIARCDLEKTLGGRLNVPGAAVLTTQPAATQPASAPPPSPATEPHKHHHGD